MGDHLIGEVPEAKAEIPESLSQQWLQHNVQKRSAMHRLQHFRALPPGFPQS
jgi:hypothetical protein